jgi:hypothetical protein
MNASVKSRTLFPLVSEEFWSLREGMTVHVPVKSVETRLNDAVRIVAPLHRAGFAGVYHSENFGIIDLKLQSYPAVSGALG